MALHPSEQDRPASSGAQSVLVVQGRPHTFPTVWLPASQAASVASSRGMQLSPGPQSSSTVQEMKSPPEVTGRQPPRARRSSERIVILDTGPDSRARPWPSEVGPSGIFNNIFNADLRCFALVAGR